MDRFLGAHAAGVPEVALVAGEQGFGGSDQDLVGGLDLPLDAGFDRFEYPAQERFGCVDALRVKAVFAAKVGGHNLRAAGDQAGELNEENGLEQEA
ncbi:MAG: hypothetical protein KJ072_07395 [Verrucomicrobia bacterium]|nr:hypothetical protein [Verrucomicrobiota bacterium]